jgi:hypothetical protein
VTVSEGHPFRSRSGKIRDLGGPFFTEKSYVVKPENSRVDFSQTYGNFNDGQITDKYSGNVLPIAPVAFPPSIRTSDDDLDELGATAIARCKPDNSVASLSTFLGETFREGLPHLLGSRTWESRTLSARNAGDEYLNAQFGWKPLVSDITKFGNAVTHLDKVLAQYERDAGKLVRRKYYFPLKKSVSDSVIKTGAFPYGPIQNDQRVQTYGTVVRRRETLQRQWFSGAFTYYLPSGYDSRNKLSRMALLADRLGLSLTPDTLWNLAPWSWAVDWFSNTGDVISNVTSFKADGLVLWYGYIMETSIVTDTYSMDDFRFTGSDFRVPRLTVVTETKVRRRADPYGFGVHWDTLSTFQLSILSALGITRR